MSKLKPECYAVIACRWGWENEGFSVLLVTPDKHAAIAEADRYSEYRGGKYGVGVYDADGTEVYHACSSYQEKGMSHNHRIDMFARVGGYFASEWELGKEPTLEKGKEQWESAVSIEQIVGRYDL